MGILPTQKNASAIGILSDKKGIGQNLEGSAKIHWLRTSAHRLGLRKKLGINHCQLLTRQVI